MYVTKLFSYNEEYWHFLNIYAKHSNIFKDIIEYCRIIRANRFILNKTFISNLQ